MTLFLNSVTDRSCINRIACNSHSDNKKLISGTHVDNEMCGRLPLRSVISGSIGVRAGERFFIGLTQLTRCQPVFKSFLSRVVYTSSATNSNKFYERSKGKRQFIGALLCLCDCVSVSVSGQSLQVV